MAKIRACFVSNSSSSSFVCDVSGEEFSGMNLELDDFDGFECENGHTFLGKYMVNSEEYDDWYEEQLEEDEDVAYDSRYELPEKYCPICQFKVATDRDIAAYLLHHMGQTREQFVAKLKDEFGTYETFKEWLGK